MSIDLRRKNLSGSSWWLANQAKYPNSTSIHDLEPSFLANVWTFLSALRKTHASVRISTTKRSYARAHLMHYSWKLAHGELKPSEIPKLTGVDIEWDHGDLKTSIKAAQQMVDLFRMRGIAVLDSLHLTGKAIDMTISWTGTLKINQKGAKKWVEINSIPRNGDNSELHKVGKTYGVIKFVSTLCRRDERKCDEPHWSYNGK